MSIPPQTIICNCATPSPLPTLLCHPFSGVPHASACPLRFLLGFAAPASLTCIMQRSPHLHFAPTTSLTLIPHLHSSYALASSPGICIPLGTMRRGLLGVCVRSPGGVWLELSTGHEARMHSCLAAPGSYLTSPELFRAWLSLQHNRIRSLFMLHSTQCLQASCSLWLPRVYQEDRTLRDI